MLDVPSPEPAAVVNIPPLVHKASK